MAAEHVTPAAPTELTSKLSKRSSAEADSAPERKKKKSAAAPAAKERKSKKKE